MYFPHPFTNRDTEEGIASNELISQAPADLGYDTASEIPKIMYIIIGNEKTLIV